MSSALRQEGQFAQAVLRGARLAGLGLELAPDSPIRWLPVPLVDQWGQTTLGHYGGWAVQLNVMIFTDRLVLAEPGPLGSPCYGWCYPKGGAAHLAALAWNPETEGEPAGYIKAKPGGRQPGERAPWWRPMMA